MSKIAEQLLEDANKRVISKDELLEACINAMSEDQLYEMAIENHFIETGEDVEYADVNLETSPQERIIEAVLARHGE